MGFAAVRVPSVGSPTVGTGVTRQRKPHFPVKNVQFPGIRLVSKPNSSIINGEFQSFPPAAGAADRSYQVEWSEGAPGISTEDLGLGKQQPLLELGFTTNLVQIEPLISTNKDKDKVSNPKTQNANKEEGHDHRVEGGFVVPESNTFGHSFRDYEKESERKASVEEFYKNNHIYQTYEFAKKKKEEYGKLEKTNMSIWECCELLNEFVDESDPDLDEPQIEHLLQSAEAIRKDYPDHDWLHLTALIHDLGKVLLHPSFGGEPQWCVVGDTFPLGCAFHECIVHHQYFKGNPDHQNTTFRTKLGIYSENCGLDKVTMSWGHDEYMYLVAKGNKTTLPPAALFIIRFHSFYALHRSGAYTYLMNDDDKEMLKWLQVFSKYDLYSKSNVKINQEEVKAYYLSLIEKYFPAKLRW